MPAFRHNRRAAVMRLRQVPGFHVLKHGAEAGLKAGVLTLLEDGRAGSPSEWRAKRRRLAAWRRLILQRPRRACERSP